MNEEPAQKGFRFQRKQLLVLAGLLVLLLLPLGFPRVPNTQDSQIQAASYVYPIVAARLSSGFGNRKHPIYKAARHHKGIDLAAPDETPIRAIRAGTVVFADSYAGYGKLVVVLHDDGLTSHYGHCKSIEVPIGKRIEAGHILARVGSTGRVTGPHLHFEIRRNGVAQNPEEFLPGLKAKALG